MRMLRRLIPICIAIPMWAGATRFQVQVTPAAPSLSDTIRLDVRVTATDDSDLVIDPVDIPSRCVRIQNVTDQGLHQTLTLDPVKPGPCSIPPFRLRCLHGRTDSCDARSAATVIPIHTVVADPDTAEIRDTGEVPLVPPEDPNRGRPSPLIIALTAAAAITLAGLIFLRWRAWRGRPAVRARRRLRQLRGSEPAFPELVRVLRDYLDERIGLGAQFCSSHELRAALRMESLGLGSAEPILADFLNTCDRGRFARTTPPGAFHDALENCDVLIEYLDIDIARRECAGV